MNVSVAAGFRARFITQFLPLVRFWYDDRDEPVQKVLKRALNQAKGQTLSGSGVLAATHCQVGSHPKLTRGYTH